MPRCTSCNKFCSTEREDPSVDDIAVNNDLSFDGKVTEEAVEAAWRPGNPSFLSVTAVVSVESLSTCCGDTAEETRVEIDAEVTDETILRAVRDHLATNDGDHDLEIEEEEVNYVEGDGKKVSDRVDVSWKVSCCGEKLGEGTSSGDVDEWEAAW